ncbi:hypothetical protein [Nocardia sp. alder85J]|uniref:hypothetical protein n=1 Tax=Nocardia sp. alder85J TaxID=2862949 RepID=UPI001CD37182|nr:hypothetical protein [Nocardia sp. alder85J]MCX4094976.1 hypothetical protein [Nocardia sp. alder85J]
MFAAAVLIPSPPVLLPELCGGLPDRDPDHLAAQVRPLRDAVLAAGLALSEADRWTVVGAAEHEQTLGPGTVGTFRGFGADVRVGLSDAALTGRTPADPALPLPVLLGGWLRGQVAPRTPAQARLVGAAATAEHCGALGAALRRELDTDPGTHGVLVVADGAATLSTAAPGYLDERAAAVQERLDAALSAGDRTALAALDPSLCAELEISGRAAFQLLAGLFDADPKVDTRYCAAPFGVAYHVSIWTDPNPAHRS